MDFKKALTEASIFWATGIALLFAWALSGCADMRTVPDPNVVYRHDMLLDVNGTRGEGMLVVPAAERFRLKVEARGNLDLFAFATCHREQVTEEAWEHGWFKNKRKVEFDYVPVRAIEHPEYCPVKLGGYEQGKERHSWAFLDFETPEATLPAVVRCNGSQYNSRGVTVCQSHAGLVQEIEFPVDALVEPDAPCAGGEWRGRTYRYEMPKGLCVFAFMEKGGQKRLHRLSTLGYEKVLIRD